MASPPDSPRRGLPRVPGGEPWPPAPGPDAASSTAEVSSDADGLTASADATAPEASSEEAARPEAASDAAAVSAGPVPGTAGASEGRRGLPRVPGGEPWPPVRADEVAGAATDADAPAVPAVDQAPTVPPAPAPTVPPTSTPSVVPPTPRPPLTVKRSVWPGAAASAVRPPKTEPRRIGAYTPAQWVGSAVVLGAAALVLAGIVVAIARVWLSLEPGRAFLAAYPGEYALPASAPVGLPAWLGWQHFLNSFFLLLIIRSGLQVRREKRPAAFWSPRRDKKRRISLALWFHQAVDILWVANGVVFVVLLFTTGQWMRIVPTSWDVFPNALSAAMQYASLDWPTENGWVNYNSLQQLSYFAITFVAAPLAIVSGVRLSGIWPKNVARLNRLYPAEWARMLHFPVMLFFVAFIVVHVGLVLATGALRNLDHMYAARGSTDPGAYSTDPTGLLIFAASVLVMAAAWIAARPAVLVPIARLFGEVKQR